MKRNRAISAKEEGPVRNALPIITEMVDDYFRHDAPRVCGRGDGGEG
jgi:hypothetical protein